MGKTIHLKCNDGVTAEEASEIVIMAHSNGEVCFQTFQGPGPSGQLYTSVCLSNEEACRMVAFLTGQPVNGVDNW